MFSHIDPNMLLSFILLLIIAAVTAYYASCKGRNPVTWFIIGILLGIFAPLILLFLPVVKADEGDGPSMTIQNPDPAVQRSPQPPLTPAQLKIQHEEEKLWYYLDQNHEQVGPVTIVALRELWNRGILGLNSFVWSEGMEKWEKVDQLLELKGALNTRN